MRDDYLQEARKIIPDANILINVISKRVKQLRSTADYSVQPPKYNHTLGDVFEKLSPRISPCAKSSKVVSPGSSVPRTVCLPKADFPISRSPGA